jgi:hypothetical protein
MRFNSDPISSEIDESEEQFEENWPFLYVLASERYSKMDAGIDAGTH